MNISIRAIIALFLYVFGIALCVSPLSVDALSGFLAMRGSIVVGLIIIMVAAGLSHDQPERKVVQ